MPDLIVFLRARLDEDGHRADPGPEPEEPNGYGDDWSVWHDTHECWRQAMDAQPHSAHCGYRMGEFQEPCCCDEPKRVLAEVTAKRAILDLYEHWNAYVPVTTGSRQAGKMQAMIDAASRCALGDVVEALAQPYARHPDFDPAWSTQPKDGQR